MDENKVINQFIGDFEKIITDLTLYSGYLKLSPEIEKSKDEALKILRKKLKKIHKSDSKADLKKIIKLKKLLGVEE